MKAKVTMSMPKGDGKLDVEIEADGEEADALIKALLHLYFEVR